MMKKYVLSKSTFIRGLKCSKALYLNKHHKDLRDELSEQQEAIFEQGTRVGELAQNLFPGGIDCTPEELWNLQESVSKTKEAIEQGANIIYEAAFQFDEVLVLLDILVKDEECWKAYEVKSSTSVHETYINDATIQSYVIGQCGINLKDVSIVHLNNQYVFDGELNINQLFSINSVKEQVDQLLPMIPRQIRLMKEVLAGDEVPDVKIGTHCNSPYPCDFLGHCWSHIPEYSVFDIRYARGKDWELYEQGYLTTTDIPDDYPLNERHQIQVSGDKFGEKIIDKGEVKKFLKTIQYPLAHIDFETFQMAVPNLVGTRPYQQICFQWSAHIQKEHNGTIDHKEYLGIQGEDPREAFIISLIEAMEGVKTILVYNIGFERGRLNELAEQFPKYEAAIRSIIDRMDDLMIPFQKRHIYYPEMRGSYSIKKVLPALVPELSYKDLNIQEGGTASSTYANLHLVESQAEIEQIRKDLLAYCELDTYAMVKILEKLEEIIS